MEMNRAHVKGRIREVDEKSNGMAPVRKYKK